MQINNLQSLVSNPGGQGADGAQFGGIDEMPSAQTGAIFAGLGGVLWRVLWRVLWHQPVLPPSART